MEAAEAAGVVAAAGVEELVVVVTVENNEGDDIPNPKGAGFAGVAAEAEDAGAALVVVEAAFPRLKEA